MKKISMILFLVIVMISTIAIAAYPEDLEEITNDGLVEFKVEEDSITDESLHTNEAEVVEDDMYVCEEEATINQVIDGNLYVMAKKIKIDGASILGNVYAMGEEIEIVNSTINASAYLMGKDISFSGEVNDLYVLGENVKFLEDTETWRTARIAAKTLELNGAFYRDVYTTVSDLTVKDNASISGNLQYTSENEANISEEAQIGNTEFSQIEVEDDTEEVKVSIFNFGDIISAAFKTLIVSLIIILMVSKFKVLNRTEKYVSDCLKLVGKGAGVLVVAPIISVALFATVVGIGLGFTLLAIYIIFLYIATSVFATEVAYRILNQKKAENKYQLKLIGLSVLVAIVIALIGMIPVLGGLVKFIVLLAGLGILFNLIFEKTKKAGEEVIVNEN